jgi:hypothetical protein
MLDWHYQRNSMIRIIARHDIYSHDGNLSQTAPSRAGMETPKQGWISRTGVTLWDRLAE